MNHVTNKPNKAAAQKLSLPALAANQNYWEAKLREAYAAAREANQQLSKIIDARAELKASTATCVAGKE